MQKTALLSIAVVASLVTAAIAQSAPEPEPAWRAGLALLGAGTWRLVPLLLPG